VLIFLFVEVEGGTAAKDGGAGAASGAIVPAFCGIDCDAGLGD